MSDEPLIVSGRERDIFIVALRSFSDSCEAPRLSPSCPFFEVSNGSPACGEQCHDLLSEYGGSTPQRRTWTIGDGLELVERPRRRRRGPEPTARPFDASAVRLHDQDRPTPTRNTISLVGELENQLKIPPALADDIEDRNYIIQACVQELIRRGFDRDELVGLAINAATSGIVAYVVVHRLLKITPDLEGDHRELDPAWTVIEDALVLAGDGDFESSGTVSFLVDGRLQHRLNAWYRTKGLEEISNWIAPSKEFLTELDASASPADLDARSAWISDRFTKTYLSTWANDSLKLEWDYVHSSARGCAAASQMALRRVDADELAREIADRSTRDKFTKPKRDTNINIRELAPIAADYLAAKKYDAAAAIFEGMHQIRPNDGEILNNWGFCLVPVDPQKAREVLERSDLAYGEKSPLVTKANLALVYYLLGLREQAMAMLVRAASAPQDSAPSWLWVIDDAKSVTLKRIVDHLAYVEELTAAIEAHPQ